MDWLEVKETPAADLEIGQRIEFPDCDAEITGIDMAIPSVEWVSLDGEQSGNLYLDTETLRSGKAPRERGGCGILNQPSRKAAGRKRTDHMNSQHEYVAGSVLKRAEELERRRDIIPAFLRKPEEPSEVLTAQFVRESKCRLQDGEYYEPWGIFTGVLLDSENRHYLRFFASHDETVMPFTQWLELNSEERHETF